MSPILLNAIFDDPGKQWLAIGAMLFLMVYFVLRPLAKKKRDPLSKMDAPGAMARQRSVEREMSNLLVELSEMARQVTAQLDTRATKLELLMKEADEKIEALQRLSGSSSSANRSAAEHAALMQPLDVPPVAPVSAPPPPAAIDPRYVEIYALADQGRSPRDIATHLGRPSGEIELILALRQ
jgi:DNA-binding NarL/FixJ family response regulator